MNFLGLREYSTEVLVLILVVLVLIPSLSLIKVVISWFISIYLSPRAHKYPKVALVIGASKGLGLALAHELMENGVSVILIGRGKEALDAAVEELKSYARQDQVVIGYCGDAGNEDWIYSIFHKLYDDDLLPEWIIANAGAARPGFSSEYTDGYKKQMSSNYFTSTALISALMQLAKDKSKKGPKIMGELSREDLVSILPRRLVFVGSVLSMTSFIGYSAYSASKYALKGLSDSLRSEYKFLGVKVHLYCPANMDTPGFEQENTFKPKITAEIEGQASTTSPRDAALALIRGIFRERYVITNDLLGELIRVASNVSGPRPNPVSEALAAPLLLLALNIWSFMVDRDVAKHFDRLKSKASHQ